MTAATILVTRPMPEAARVAERLGELGYDTVVAPLQSVEAMAWSWPTAQYYQALLVTSANAARQISPKQIPKHFLDRPIFAVGDHTATVLRNMGWVDVRSAAGTGYELAKLVIKMCPAGGGPLLHIAGAQLSDEPHTTLERAGYKFDLVTVYKMASVPRLPENLKAALQQGVLTGWTVFSPGGAAVMKECVMAEGLQDACKFVSVFALSQNVADKLSGLPWQKLEVAKEPNEQALLALLQENIKP